MDWLYVAVGLVILLLGGDALVRGAVNLSLRLGVPALIVSLTIVAFGTSAPELLISVGAVLEDVPGIALGNVIGSNTANILLVLGLPALLAPMHTSECDSRRNYLFMIAASLVFIALCFLGPLTWWHGLILLAGLGLILGDTFRAAMSHRANGSGCALSEDEEEVEGADPEMSGTKITIYIVLGLIGLPLGAELLVEGAENLARTFGVPETVIGLTLVALGTSLPELATTVMAALRRQADVALGNVIGSNMFNLLAIMGITSLVGPLPVARGLLHFDLWVMLGASVLLAPFVFCRIDITRGWGFLLTALYLAYVGRFVFI
ncbi:Inner membrane protein YrbG [Pseudoruegeria aquimaris]|uniref:Inner membrane protein YrbG n=1 Tax=Pseudoruegeria aquimaris TaxID=393663 RepID=A0A1Y5T2H6_9RHOB|nr:calcium/sodium antiporter [Pseudoruegeria aquimaris]SLN52321.1 Inner membrane protein YrbG [Pseudoruegeria aquimaris]